MNYIEIKKNLLDLKHSENLSRGITEIAIGTGSLIAIPLPLHNKSLFAIISLTILFSLMFIVDGFKKLNNCKVIRNKIKNLII